MPDEIKEIKQQVRQLFTRHPEEAGETYFQHLIFTIFAALRIVLCGMVMIVHGIFPFIFSKTASSQIEKIYLLLKKRIPKSRRNELDWDI